MTGGYRLDLRRSSCNIASTRQVQNPGRGQRRRVRSANEREAAKEAPARVRC